MPITTFFYDIGNVLINIDFEKALRRFADFSQKSPDEIRHIFSKPDIYYAYEKGRISSEEYYRRITCAAGIAPTLSFQEFSRFWCDMFYENTRETARLLRIKRRCRVFLLSNTNLLHYEYLVRRFPVLNAVDGAALSYELGCRKPEPEIYLKALEIAGAKPHECAFVDDLPENIAAAKKIGIKAFQYINKTIVT